MGAAVSLHCAVGDFPSGALASDQQLAMDGAQGREGDFLTGPGEPETPEICHLVYGTEARASVHVVPIYPLTAVAMVQTLLNYGPLCHHWKDWNTQTVLLM